MSDHDLLNTYIKTFCGKNKLDPLPGEHHFVALCVVPILMSQGKKIDEIKYINPDGMKSKYLEADKKIFDITLANNKGVEVKYSKDRIIKFTKSQFNDLKSNCLENLIGIIALVNVKDSASCLFIKTSEFKNKYIDGKSFKSDKKNYIFKVDDHIESWANLENESNIFKIFE